MKIVLIEDQAMFRGIVIKLCREQANWEIMEAGTAEDGLALCARVQPGVVLLDLDLPDAYGLDLIDRIALAAPRARIIVLSSHTEEYALHRCLQSPVDGFIDKNEEPPEAVVEAIKVVAEGRPFFSPAVNRVKQAMRNDPVAFTKLLSNHEQNLLAQFGQGRSNEEIGMRMGISANTVKNHRRTVMAKLGISNTPELMRYALEKGFIHGRSR